MNNLGEKLGYIHGLMDGLKLNREDDTVKLLGMIADVLDDMAASITQLENDQQELNDYVESIDDDLTELEEQHRDDALSGMDEDGYDIMNDEVPARRERGKLSLLRAEDEDDEEDDEDEDYDDEIAETEFYVGCVCPECGKFFSVKNPDAYDDDQKFECPHCFKHIVIAPMDLESIPSAKPVED